jgi:tRNA-modifying protein YgfZ
MQPLLVDLSNNALVSITGDDAAAFLQGQLTNDVLALERGQAQWTGWCSPKGRLLASLLLIRHADGYLAMLPAELAPAISKRLAMFVLRSKVKIADAGARYDRYGIAGPGAADRARAVAQGEGALAVQIGPDLSVALVPPGGPRPAPLASPEAWTLALIHAGIPTVVAATQEEFVPQMANFDLIGGVSFRKGCYTGQEIVARTQYRGILKKRMALAHVEGAAPAPGQSVYSAAFGDQSAGKVVNAAAAPGGGYDFLVVAQIESLRDGDLRLGSPDGAPIAIRSYPAADAPQ